MNNLTVSLDLAKRLKEAGWDKKCIFTYTDDPGSSEPYLVYRQNKEYSYHYQAPTAQELLDVLPYKTRIHKRKDFYYVKFAEKSITNSNLAEALGELVLRCVENGYLDFNETNG